MDLAQTLALRRTAWDIHVFRPQTLKARLMHKHLHPPLLRLPLRRLCISLWNRTIHVLELFRGGGTLVFRNIPKDRER